MTTLIRSLPAVALLLALGGCSPADSHLLFVDPADYLVVEDTEGVRFMLQNAPYSDVMDALYTGSLEVDEDGCLRLEPEDGESATAVWPFGYTLAADGTVIDDNGSPVGVVGDQLALGGGFVPALSDDLGFTDADRALATEHCPGSYWIVGEVPAD